MTGRREPGLLRRCAEDLDVVVARDAACPGRTAALFHLPWWGLVAHRIAHALHGRGHRYGPLALAAVAKAVTGMDVHPGARIGRRLFVDHGAGVVVGATAVIGDDVTLYHRVTLGSRGWWNDPPAPARRHPVLGDRVRVGVGASVLGAVTIAPDTLVRAHALVVHDVLPEAGVVAR